MNRSPLAVLGVCVALGACLDDGAGPEPQPPPEILGFTISAHPANVLAAIVAVSSERADSLAVTFHIDGAAAADSSTPALPAASGGQTIIPVLGLVPDSRYSIRVTAYGQDTTATSESRSFETASLPADLPVYAASGTGPSPGYVVFAAGMYGIVIDNSGRVVWYRRFENGPWLNFMAQPNDRYVARLVTPDPADVESWIEVDPLGEVTRTFGCKLGLQPRFHDLLTSADGGYWILCDETRTLDLSAYGGLPEARVTGTAVQHVSGGGDLLMHWSPFDHFDVTDVDPSTLTGLNVNWTHGNALALDADGNLLVSFRNLNEVTKIDVRTGSVLWRFGGRRNQLQLVGTDRAFAGQHCVRLRQGGDVLLLDNVGDSQESRAQRWEVDSDAGVARLVSSYGSQPPARTLIGGSVQPLPGSRTLVSFGTEGRVEEYDAQGNVVWRLNGSPGYVFRAQRIRSLYAPGAPFPDQ